MPIANWTTSSGQPLDSVGADGDMDFDFTNRFQWGPKGRITPGSWVGTANNINPLYAAPSTLNGLAPQNQAQAAFIGAVTSTPTAATAPGSTSAQTYTPSANCYLFAIMGSCNIASTVEVFNTTTNTSVVSGLTYASGNTGYGSGGIFQPNQYPLLANNTYILRITGSGSGALNLFMPVFSTPAASLGQIVSSCGQLGWSASQSFTGTGQTAPLYLQQNVGFYFRPLRTSYIYNIVATFTPTGSTTVNDSVTIFMNTQADGGSAASYYNFGKAPATGKPVTFGPFTPSQFGIASNRQFWFNINTASACTGILLIDLQVVQ